jgi:hypothetical protein
MQQTGSRFSLFATAPTSLIGQKAARRTATASDRPSLAAAAAEGDGDRNADPPAGGDIASSK